MAEGNSGNPFYQMVENLLLTNSIALFGRIDVLTPKQVVETLDLLETYYRKESIGYPHAPPSFDWKAASWSASILFHAAQLVMYREHSGDEISDYFREYKPLKSASAILTVDLSFRFLPGILKYLEQIDLEDELIPILKKILRDWHYSGLLSHVKLETVDFDPILSSDCLTTLYVDRVIACKQKEIGKKEEIRPFVLSALGNYRNEFWKDFNTTL